MTLCLNVGSVAKLVVGGNEFQTLTTLSAKNWLRAPLLQCDLKSLCVIKSFFHLATKSHIWQMSKTFIGCKVYREFEWKGASGRRKCQTMSHAAENSSVFRCALKVVMAAELFVTRDREFQAADAMMLNALDLKLIIDAFMTHLCRNSHLYDVMPTYLSQHFTNLLRVDCLVSPHWLSAVFLAVSIHGGLTAKLALIPSPSWVFLNIQINLTLPKTRMMGLSHSKD